MKKLFIVVVLMMMFLLVLAGKAEAQIYTPPDSCLKMVYPNEPDWGYINPDSVKVDSCNNSPSYKKWYAKKYIALMSLYIFYQKPLIMNVGYTWRDIDTNFVGIRNEFANIETLFGNYYFVRDKISNDSIFLATPWINIKFENYACFDSVYFYVGKINTLEWLHINNPTILDVQDKPINSEKFPQKFIIQNEEIMLYFDEHTSNNPTLSVYDINGNVIFRKRIYKDLNENRFLLNFSFLNSGLYFIRYENKSIMFLKIK